jgi:putative salt-induced outer membrane protein
MKFIRSVVFVAFTFVAVMPTRALAEPKKPWEAKAEASVLSTNGNSKTTTTGIKAEVKRNWEKFTLEGAAGGLGSRSGDDVTAEEYFANEKGSYFLTERTYLQEKFGWEKNRFKGVRGRYDATAGLGHKLILLPRHEWLAELGAGHVWEERTDDSHNNYASGRAYSKYAWKFSETATFSQDAEYLHSFENSDDYNLKTETALTASLTSRLALKTSFTWRRDGVPPAGFIRDDTTTSVALVINY